MRRFHKLSTGLIVAGLALVLTQSVMAQSKIDQKGTGPAGDDSDFAQQILGESALYCLNISQNSPTIADELEDEGWVVDLGHYGNEPYFDDLSASKDYPGFGSANIWGFIEYYPDFQIGYCSYEILLTDLVIDVASISDNPDVLGSTTQSDTGLFGSWRINQPLESNPNMFLHAYQDDEKFFYQITTVLRDF